MHEEQGVIWSAGALLAVSLAVTLSLLVLEGRWSEAIPLHLCSVSALVAIALAFFPAQSALDFLWYLGMPGAALALFFPAPALIGRQALMNASYTVTHALILVVPALRILGGMRPRRGRTLRMLAALMLLAVAASAVNDWLGTDFLFLSAPPAGTPLETVFALGAAPYRAFLLVMMLALCLAMDALAAMMHRHTVQ